MTPARTNPLDALLNDLADRVAERLAGAAAPPARGPELWTVKDAMRETGLARDTVYRLIHAGVVRSLREHPHNPRSRILIQPESLRAWIRAELETQSARQPGPEF